MRLLLGDSLHVLRSLSAESIDSVVTDPPYGLAFMGKRWDYDVPSVGLWREVFRVLKPGGHLLAFAGTRTQHRMAVNIEDAGFEIRDMIAWVYGSGFPKSHNLKGSWDGWGTALKPALEPVTVARKPLIGTVAVNVQQFGTGAINVDGCRIGSEQRLHRDATSKKTPSQFGAMGGGVALGTFSLGRWPANLIHDGSDEVTGLFPETGKGRSGGVAGWQSDYVGGKYKPVARTGHDDNGGSAARFFYCAKASQAERSAGLEHRESTNVNDGRSTSIDNPYQRGDTQRRNVHPTVKPIALMRYLVRLVTPPGGTVLDPFTGSGTTGIAAALEGFDFVGIEREPEYLEIARARIAHWSQRPASSAPKKAPDVLPGQLSLFGGGS